MAVYPGPECSQSSAPDISGQSSQTVPSSQLLEHDRFSSPACSSHVPQSRLETSDTDLTPPTSSSGLSSQEVLASEGYQRAENGVGLDADRESTPRSSGESHSGKRSPLESSAALKRTSSGLVKKSGAHGMDTCRQDEQRRSGHSRNSSLFSNGTSVTELSQQLKTRLSYAMVKVQNGWESKTLEEIESLGINSPSRSPIIPTKASSIDLRLEPRQSSHVLRASNSCRDQNSTVPERVSAPGTSPRDQVKVDSQTDRPQQNTTVGKSQKRALAPPADIVPRPRRRPHHANALRTEYNPLNSPIGEEVRPRTASQNAAMEADAVETLLFLASPGNSATHPSGTNKSQSPVRASVSVPAQVSPTKPLSPIHARILSSPRQRVTRTDPSQPESGSVPFLSPSDEIDRMIDDFEDKSTDSGLEHNGDTDPQTMQSDAPDKKSSASLTRL